MTGPTIEQPDFRPETRIEIANVEIDIVRQGKGKPLLFLHSVDGVNPDAPFFTGLTERFDVIAPWHPGFGHSELPSDFTSIHDLAYFYLELVEQLAVEDAVLLGTSFGGWLAAEIAIRDASRFSHIVLVDALGVKFGDRENRDIADMFAVPQDELTALAYHDAEKRIRDYSKMTDWEHYAIARSRETYTYMGWKPYMHDPGLKYWLRRIRVPTLVLWGESDGITDTDYGRAYAEQIPGARFEIIAEAAHYPHVEQPDSFLGKVTDFVFAAAPARKTA